MVSLMKLTVPSAVPKQQSRFANPKHLKTERSESNLRLCGEYWPNSSKILFPDGDDEGAFIVPLLDARSQVLSITDRRNGIGKPGFKLASLGSGQTFTLVAPDLCGPGVSPEVLQRVLSQAAWRVGAPFSVVSRFDVFYNFVISLTRSVILHDATPCPMEDPQYECGRP